VVCGGDGTLQEAASALAGADCVLAPLPAGRCNDFCRALGGGWRAGDLAGALVADEGRVAAVDLGLANGLFFCTVGAIGFDAAVSRYVDRMRLPLLTGTPAYLYAVLRMLRLYQPPQARVRWEGGAYEGPLFLAAVGNTATYGNGMLIVPPARPDDGMLDLCLVRPAGFWRVVSLLPAMLMGRHGRAREVSFARSARVEIDCAQGVEMWADGELLVRDSHLLIEVAPAALQVLLPSGSG
jgi:diacylglycerol kinase (ATP)